MLSGGSAPGYSLVALQAKRHLGSSAQCNAAQSAMHATDARSLSGSSLTPLPSVPKIQVTWLV